MKHILLFIALVIAIRSNAQTQFWSDTFEDSGAPSSGTRTASTTFSATTQRYFFRTNTSGISTTNTYTSMEGSMFWAGEDIDNLTGNGTQTSHQNITWSGINISGKTGLSFKGLFATGANTTWDQGSATTVTDYLIISYRIDGGNWSDILRFLPNIPNSSSGALALETTNDSIGDGTALTNVFSEFSAPISGTGTILELRFKCSANASLEELAVDNLRLLEAPACSSPVVTNHPASLSVCNGSNINFQVSATGSNLTYQWQANTGSGFSDLTNNGTYTGVNTATLSAATGLSMNNYQYRCVIMSGLCSSTSNAGTLTVTAIPTVAATNATICSGNSTMLSASGATTYTWSNASTGAVISVSPTSTTSYTVTGTLNDCTNSAIAVVTVNSSPTLIANSTSICEGTSANLTVSGASTYIWSNGTSGSSITVSPNNTTTYTVIGTNVSNCSSSTSITVNVEKTPLIAVGNAATICSGESASLFVQGNADHYLWSTGESTTTIIVKPSVNTTYTVAATNNSGCSTTGSVSVSINPLPTLITSSDVTITSGNNTTLTATGAFSYSWSPSTGLNIVIGPSVTASPLVTTTYTLTATDTYGCTASATITVTVDAITGINTISSSRFSLYPNPAQNSVHINVPANFNPTSICVFDLTGKILIIQQVDANATTSYTLSTEGIPSGIYLLRISNEKASEHIRLLID